MATTHQSVGLGVGLLCAVQFIDVLGVTSATTALPAIAEELDAGPEAVTAIATAYAAFFGGFLVVSSRLGDRWGHRRVLLIGLVLFAAVAVVGATANSPLQVVAARALQGLAAAIGVPSALRILLHLTPRPEHRAAAIAAWSAAGAAAGAGGYLAGGMLTDWWSWRATFWINTPIGLALAALILWRITSSPRVEKQGRLDLPGAGLLVGSVMTLVGGATLCQSPGTRLIGAIGILAGAGLSGTFIMRQRRTPEPLIPPEALRQPTLRAGALLSLVNTATTSSSGVLVTLHLQQQLGSSPLEAGLRLLPLSLAVIVGSASAKPLHSRLRPASLAGLGLVLIAAGNLGLAAAAHTATGITLAVIVIGLGLGQASVAATDIGTTVPDHLSGTASGIINTAAQVGTALGVAIFLAIAAALGTSPAGTVIAWILVAVVAATSAGLSVRARAALPRRGAHDTSS